MIAGLRRFQTEDEEGWTYKGEQIVRRWIRGGNKNDKGFWIVVSEGVDRRYHVLDDAARAIDKMQGAAS